jgi:hypothetical protein
MLSLNEQRILRLLAEAAEPGDQVLNAQIVRTKIEMIELERDMKNPHAAALGRLGGKATSEAKTRAARKNGAKGGRPRKKKLAEFSSAVIPHSPSAPPLHKRDAFRKAIKAISKAMEQH